jgi:orotate phosphoribosyltransferase
MNWNSEKKRFYEFIIKNKVIGFFKEPIRLKSNRLSYFYINWRNVSEDVNLIDKLTDYIISFVKSHNLNPDCFYGVPEGASKIGIITQFKWAKMQKNYETATYILPMGRGKPKDHGEPKDRFFLGMPKGKVIVIEDVTTTGGSLITSIKKLKVNKVDIIAAIGITNRNELRDDGKSVEEVIREEDVNYYAMSNAVDLLPNLTIDKDIAIHLEKYFKNYGTREVKFS